MTPKSEIQEELVPQCELFNVTVRDRSDDEVMFVFNFNKSPSEVETNDVVYELSELGYSALFSVCLDSSCEVSILEFELFDKNDNMDWLRNAELYMRREDIQDCWFNLFPIVVSLRFDK